MTTPIQRLTRLLDEGARFMVEIPGHVAIDLTPDVIAMLDGVQTDLKPLVKSRNLLETNDLGGDFPTRVHFT